MEQWLLHDYEGLEKDVQRLAGALRGHLTTMRRGDFDPGVLVRVHECLDKVVEFTETHGYESGFEDDDDE